MNLFAAGARYQKRNVFRSNVARRYLLFVAMTVLSAGMLSVRAASAEKPRIAASAEQVTPPGVGASIPDAPLRRTDGTEISLHDALGGKPTILVVYRGGWCPYCTRHLAGLRDIHDRLRALGYRLIALSPDTPEHAAQTMQKEKLDYTVLTDPAFQAMQSLGLAFRLSDETRKRYAEMKLPLRSPPGSDEWVLPVPAVFLITPDRRIAFRHYDPDYRKRLDPLAAVAAAQAARDAQTPEGDVHTELVEYRAGDTTCKGYLAYPTGLKTPRPGVVVFHEWWGLNDYARRRARQLAALGYVALAADMYGGGASTTERKKAGQLAGVVRKNPALMRERVRAALDALARQPLAAKDKLAALGYCFGGTCALELARSGADVRGVISFHGGLSTAQPADPKTLRARILVCHGDVDPHVSAEEMQAFQKEMRQAAADWMLVRYAGAVHAFTNPASGSKPESGVAYDPLADVRSWEHMQDFLRQVLGPLEKE